MATTAYGLNHPLAVKVWSRKLFREAIAMTWAKKFMGTTTNSLFMIKSDLQKGPGDRIRCGLRVRMEGDGISGDATLEGNEEALVTHTDNVFIDQLRHACRSDGRMSEQRVPFSIREECRAALADWWAERIDESFFNQLTGFHTANTKRTGLQAAPTITSAHIIPGGSKTGEGSLSATANDILKLSDIDKAVAHAKTLQPLIRPLRVNGGEHYVLFIHPYQTYQLRNDTSTNGWATIQQAAMQGGMVSKNPIFIGALGMHNGVILHESTRIPNTISASGNGNFRRAVFCGAQAGLMAFGQRNGPNRMSWVEEAWDYKNQLGVAAGMIFGMKKTQFNSADFATIVMPSYAPDPTSL